jgi:hypothetical protein
MRNVPLNQWPSVPVLLSLSARMGRPLDHFKLCDQDQIDKRMLRRDRQFNRMNDAVSIDG